MNIKELNARVNAVERLLTAASCAINSRAVTEYAIAEVITAANNIGASISRDILEPKVIA